MQDKVLTVCFDVITGTGIMGFPKHIEMQTELNRMDACSDWQGVTLVFSALQIQAKKKEIKQVKKDIKDVKADYKATKTAKARTWVVCEAGPLKTGRLAYSCIGECVDRSHIFVCWGISPDMVDWAFRIKYVCLVFISLTYGKNGDKNSH